MRLFSWKMQARHRGIFIGVCGISAVFICLHLIGEVSRLENAREKLERAVAKLQDDGSGRVGHPRHLSATYDQVEINTQADDDLIIMYNRVPKTGSTSFAGIAYDLCKRNGFNVLHVNTSKNAHVMSLSDQRRFVQNTTEWHKTFRTEHDRVAQRFVQNTTEWHSKKPALYHGHFAFLDFLKFGARQQPVFINLIRDPLERFISYYYFVRYGDDFRPSLRRRKAGNKETFDECVRKEGNDCDPVHLWLQIPFFCGQDAECWKPGSQWALKKAKDNLLQNYLVVGVTEELGDFIAVLEATLPRFFRGAVKLFNEGNRSHLRKTSNKLQPKPETMNIIRESKIWKMENDFYQFVLEQFHFVKTQTFELSNGAYVEKGNKFHYEKIRPR